MFSLVRKIFRRKQRSDPWHLMEAQRFEDALAAYGDALLKRPEPGTAPVYAIYANRAIALICLDRFEEAIQNMDLAQQNAPDNYWDELAVLHWLCGRRARAQELLTNAMEAIQRGDPISRDFAGGAGPGLLLWYMSVTLQDSDAMDRSKQYLQWLVQTSRYRLWPMPLAEFIVAQRSADELLPIVTKKISLAKALTVATRRKNILMRRRLSQVFFYQAVQARLRKAESEAMDLFNQVVALKDPIIEMEWHLARAEAMPQKS